MRELTTVVTRSFLRGAEATDAEATKCQKRARKYCGYGRNTAKIQQYGDARHPATLRMYRKDVFYLLSA